MEYIKSLLYLPKQINKDHLYHTYAGKILKIDKNKHSTTLHFEEYPDMRFRVSCFDIIPENITSGCYVLMNYCEGIHNDDKNLFLFIETIDLITTYTFSPCNILTVYCLTCGEKLPLREFIQCKGVLTKYEHYFASTNTQCNLCDNKFFNSNSQCTRGHYKCFWCFTERIISY